MRTTPTRTIGAVAGILALAALINGVWLGGRPGQWAADITAPILAPLTAKMGWAKEFLGVFTSRVDVASQNLVLRDQVAQLQGQLADIDQLRAQMRLYQAAANLKERGRGVPIVAGVTSWPRQGGVADVVVNRGSRDGVAVGDVVATPASALVGIVRQVFADHSLVSALGDPTLQLAGRIMGTTVTGLVRTDGDGLLLDLVKKDEAVIVGSVVTTSGNDQFPSGLVVGTVRSVDAGQATLFSVVRIAPAAADTFFGAVFIIRP